MPKCSFAYIEYHCTRTLEELERLEGRPWQERFWSATLETLGSVNTDQISGIVKKLLMELYERLALLERLPASFPPLTPAAIEQVGSLKQAIILVTHFREWALAMNKASKPDTPKTRNGRPTKDETPSHLFVLTALCHHHEYRSDGSIGNYEPASLDLIHSLMKKGAKPGQRVPAKNAMTRFLQDRLGKENAYARYKTACQTRKINQLLRSWRNEQSARHAELRDN